MELKSILNELESMDSDGMPKEASDKKSGDPSEKTAEAKKQLLGALDEVLQPQEAEKTASQESPSATAGLLKIAGDLANSEQEALVKEAKFWGAAVADGFMERLAVYEQAMSKTAGEGEGTAPTDEDFHKFAEENPELVKQAMELGYFHGKAQIEQLKQAAFEAGYTDAAKDIDELSKTAEGREKLAELAAGLEKEASDRREINETIEKLAQTPEGQEKLAAIEQGYNDAMEKIAEVADEVFARGYNNTIQILQAM